MIRDSKTSDLPAILAIVQQSGQFDASGLGHVRETLEQHLAGNGEGVWLTADDGDPVGVAYCAPEPVASGTWNLLLLWTRSDRHGRGHGGALVARVEAMLANRSARLLIVETSGLPAFSAARAFYEKNGFAQEATIRNFFADGDDKLVLTKAMRPNLA